MTAAPARTDVVELLHVGSLTAAGVGACCVAADGPRPRVRELALSVIMVLAMLDVVLGAHAVPVVVWSALTLMLAMVLAVRRRRVAQEPAVARMRLYSGLGAVLMATLMLVMSAGSSPAAAHQHGVTPGMITAGLLVATVGYAAACAVVMRDGHRSVPHHGATSGRIAARALLRERLQLGSMAGSVVLLALAAALG